jgi:hypothetical protein
MARAANFPQNPDDVNKHKSLRTHAREAAEYLTGLPYKQPKSPTFEGYNKPGRGVSGESSN